MNINIPCGYGVIEFSPEENMVSMDRYNLDFNTPLQVEQISNGFIISGSVKILDYGEATFGTIFVPTLNPRIIAEDVKKWI